MGDQGALHAPQRLRSLVYSDLAHPVAGSGSQAKEYAAF